MMDGVFSQTFSRADWFQAEQAKANLAKAEGKYEQYKADLEAKADYARRESLKKIDQFDATVEKKAAEAKSGFFSWFGGK